MLKGQLYTHGGDIYTNAVQYDFSVNVNPMGLPKEAADALKDLSEAVQHYPDAACRKLVRKLAEHFHIRAENVLCGNGASELIYNFAALRFSKALLVAPCFSEYERAFRSYGTSTVYCVTKAEDDFMCRPHEVAEQLKQAGADVLVLAIPFNPSGGCMESAKLRTVLAYCQRQNITVLLDMCFAGLSFYGDFLEAEEIVQNYKNVCIVGAFTKSFAMAGLRLGFALCGCDALLDRMAAYQSCWNVSVPAQLAGAAALQSGNFLEISRALIRKERAFLTAGLEALGIRCYAGYANYILFYDDVLDWYSALLPKGILIRQCADYMGLSDKYYRIAVRQHQDNVYLLQTMGEIRLKNKG